MENEVTYEIWARDASGSDPYVVREGTTEESALEGLNNRRLNQPTWRLPREYWIVKVTRERMDL